MKAQEKARSETYEKSGYALVDLYSDWNTKHCSAIEDIETSAAALASVLPRSAITSGKGSTGVIREAPTNRSSSRPVVLVVHRRTDSAANVRSSVGSVTPLRQGRYDESFDSTSEETTGCRLRDVQFSGDFAERRVPWFLEVPRVQRDEECLSLTVGQPGVRSP
jgi:hypothetical protein